jgi:2,4-dienoyl-CoA reductase-like NADH-dependent reductase (Old Yellow Enzyme family)
MADHNALFSPTTFGSLKLKHRVIMAPLTRSRSVQPDSVPGDLMPASCGSEPTRSSNSGASARGC